MSMLKEFKEFAMKGNVVDLAVGVVIGAAFGKIVTSLVEDVIMPIIGKVLGTVDFSNLYWNFGDPAITGTLAEAKKLGPVFAWGNFLTVSLNFLIIAFAIFFFVVKPINKLKKPKIEQAVVDSLSKDQELLTEIRDLLKKSK